MPIFSRPTTLDKFSRLENDPTDLSNVSQLVFPQNILNGFGTGHFVLINFNVLAGSRYRDRNFRVENPAGDIVSGLSEQPAFYTRGYTIASQLNGGGRYIRSPESIIFPMPDSVASTYGIEWTAVELGAAGQAARGLSTFNETTLQDAANVLAETSKSVAASTIETLTGVQVNQTKELYSGTITNPFLEVLFKGVNTRTFSLDFKLSPRNRDESSILAEMIRRLKFHMHPEFKFRENEGSYLRYPSNFDITFMKIENGEATRNVWLHRINTSVLVSLTEDASAGGYSVHADDSPVVRSLSLQFQEVAPLRKGDFTSVEDSF